MRVLFVNPPVVPSGAVPPPLAIAALCSWVASECESIRILDYDLLLFDGGNRSTAFVRSRLAAEMDSFRPDVVLFSSMYNNSVIACDLMAQVKRDHKDACVVAGGPHFGAQPALALKTVPALDFVVAGEGEVVLATLFRALRGACDLDSVPNLGRRLDGKIVLSPASPLIDLQEVANVWKGSAPFLDLDQYVSTISPASEHRAIYIEAGRGCPYRCNFCAPAEFWNHRYRTRSLTHLADEVRYLHESFGFDAFILVHDLLTADRRFVRDLCAMFKNLELPVRWMANSRTDLEDSSTLGELATSGCWRLFFGIDSASPRQQSSFGKFLDVSRSFEVVADAASRGIGTVCSFVVGHASETGQELSESILLAARLKFVGAENVQFHRLRIFPPAPLSAGSPPFSELDETTFRLEFPFAQIESNYLDDLRNNREFYSGYFPPLSTAGTAQEISQVELFFTQAVAFAPLTVYGLATVCEKSIMDAFREHLQLVGNLERYSLDPTAIDLVRNWGVVRKRLEWMSSAEWLSFDKRELLAGIIDYEDARLRFVHCSEPPTSAVLWTDAEAIISLSVAIDRTVEAARCGRPLTSSLCQPTLIRMRRHSSDVEVWAL